MDDWWLVRDQQGRVGWVLAHMVDLDIPLDVAQYAEGQRIQAAFVLNTVQDEEKGTIPQYLVLLNENKDGIPYDFNQVRVFTWNLKRHRYETGYREHYIIGYFPAKVSSEDFGKEGIMPVFTIRKQNADGSISERKYRVIGNIVRQVQAPGGSAAARPRTRPTNPRRMIYMKRTPDTEKAAHAGRLSADSGIAGLKLNLNFHAGQSIPAGPTRILHLSHGGYAAMAEKIKKLDLQRDYKKYLYFIDGKGNVCHKPKSGVGESKILVEHAVDRDNQYLYFIDKEGDISRSPRGQKKKAA